ncbi:hypothetical protein FH972_021183 [Carpinus fangiana]|uniref:Eukaryotic translation initiation factor 5B n=1 Tax=Carpinus fangiana TaxID=176857 RepID=A0A5N6KP59_9ROSI|nr:hypothetical protein FH972_021183 [Carpinus fangiana]
MPPKKKGGNKKNDDWDEGLGETPDPIAAATEAAKQEEDAQDQEEEEGGGGGLLAALKKNRGKKAKKGKVLEDFVEGEDPPGAEPANGPLNGDAALDAKAPEEADADDLFAPAAKKKTAAPPPAPKPEKVVEEKKPEAAATPAADGGKKKKLPPHLAALQKQQEELRVKREAQEKMAAEERAAAQEADRLAEEEEKRKAEAKALKKQKEKEKIEQMKKDGTYMTKAQKEAAAAAKARMEQMIASGAKVAGLNDDSTPATSKPKKAPFTNKKKAPSKMELQKLEDERLEREAEEARRRVEELRIADEQAKKVEAEAEKARKEAESKKEESEGEDWEAQADAIDGDVKDSWDADSDEDEGPAKSKANGKPVQAGSASKTRIVDGSDSDSEEDDDDDSDSESDEEASANAKEIAKRKAEAAQRREQRHQDALAARSKDNLRSPICCILGHVDTGKTKLLDKIRQTNVQEGEAGGITQQIGATYFPVDALQKKTNVVNKDGAFEFKVPGLLVIDTPGHESFTNLRSRGSSLCNIAILVVDIMHGLEPQTLESMRLLRDRKTPFIVALNKIDRLYGWSRVDNNGFQDSLSLQKKSVQAEFERRLEETKVAFAEQGFNAELFYENKSMARNVSLVPTSAHTGEGIPDMLKLIVSLTQERMTNSLMYLSEVECTVLEVKVIEGLGTTIDVVLSNGILREGDRIVLCGLNGPIATNIRALLTPAEMKELRVKSAYVHNKEVKASLGVKISANDLEHAIAGSRLLVVGPDDDEEDLEEQVMSDLEQLLGKVSKTGRGVSVQASTLGSLEALLEFLRVSKIPVANISIGPVYKRDVMQAGVMLEKAKEFAVMLCFDVKVDKEAQAYADEVGVKIFQADIIYHLFDDFTAHTKQIAEQKKEESKLLAVFPCVLKPVAVFNKTQPIVLGVDVVEGNLRPLTPMAAVRTNAEGKKEIIPIGRVQTIERDHKAIPLCKKGQPSVAIKIEMSGNNQPMYGRHLEEKDALYSLVSRQSIDVLKEFYRADVSMEEWALIKKLKPLFDIP